MFIRFNSKLSLLTSNIKATGPAKLQMKYLSDVSQQLKIMKMTKQWFIDKWFMCVDKMAINRVYKG